MLGNAAVSWWAHHPAQTLRDGRGGASPPGCMGGGGLLILMTPGPAAPGCQNRGPTARDQIQAPHAARPVLDVGHAVEPSSLGTVILVCGDPDP